VGRNGFHTSLRKNSPFFKVSLREAVAMSTQQQTSHLLSPVIARLFAKKQWWKFSRSHLHELSGDFYKQIMAYIQNPDAPFVVKKERISLDTGEITHQYEFDVQKYKREVVSQVRQEIETYQASSSGMYSSVSFLIELYSYLYALHAYLTDALYEFEDYYVQSNTIFDELKNFFYEHYKYVRPLFSENQQHKFVDIPIGVIPGITMRLTEFIVELMYAIRGKIEIKTGKQFNKATYVINPQDVNTLMDYLALSMHQQVERDLKYGNSIGDDALEIKSFDISQLPWRSGQYVAPTRKFKWPKLKVVPTEQLSFKQKWSVLSKSKKAAFFGFIALEVIAVIACSLLLPGSQAVILPGASFIAANVLAAMIGSSVVAATAAGGVGYTLFAHRQKHMSEQSDLALSDLTAESVV
jgi:hypothetical protein